MTGSDEVHIHPRDVANKSAKENLTKAIAMALAVENEALRLNTQTFNANRYTALSAIPDYEELKSRARAIKEDSIERLPELIATLTKAVEARGGKVFIAATKDDANNYITNVCRMHEAKLVVKAKSITSEEIELNHALEAAGIEVAETDLAEFILQISNEQPSHIVAPAIHRSRQRITALFKEHFDTSLPLDTGEDLTEFARLILRQKFLSADVGISGANLIAADEGCLLLVESEGNIRLTTQLPAVHIAIAGIEKIIPSKKDLGTFIELLAASGTGQPLTSYTNILEPPLLVPVLNLNGRSDTRREFHLVLLDNGRMTMRADTELKEALYCIRCSACMNVCANFQAVGGHAFGGECYTGGIGAAWTIGTSGSLEKGRFAELCTGCSRCVPNCPVRIDIPRLNTAIKQRLITLSGGPSLQKMFFGNFSIVGAVASLAPRVANLIAALPAVRSVMELLIGFDKRRPVPEFGRSTLVRQYREHSKKSRVQADASMSQPRAVLFADAYTNYNNPQVGMAVVRVFEKLGIATTVSATMAEGRDAQSQGLVESAAARAVKTAAYLETFIDEGSDIIVAEPSVLALFRSDYKALLCNDTLFKKLRAHTYDPIEYLNAFLSQHHRDPRTALRGMDRNATRIFYHGHCQMKTVGAGSAAVDLFTQLGFTVIQSKAECCGMAGSFGYKKAYYELSKNVGDDLVRQIRAAEVPGTQLVIVASGTSCREQIGAEYAGRKIFSPVELLDTLIRSGE